MGEIMEINKEEMSALYDLQYLISNDTWEDLELNKIDGVLKELFIKISEEIEKGLLK